MDEGAAFSDAVTREQMREMDRRAIEDYGIPGLILMENAGRAAAEEVWQLAGGRLDAAVVIACGKGNNGGDGYVVARHLHNRGLNPRVFVLAPLEQISGDAGTNLAIIRRMGIEVCSLPDENDLAAFEAAAAKADIVVDALLGTGLAGEVRGLLRAAIGVINRAGRPVVAVDIPSGLDANTGAILGDCVRAFSTVTFAAAKIGMDVGSGPEMAGWIVVAEIGIPREILRSFTADGASS